MLYLANLFISSVQLLNYNGLILKKNEKNKINKNATAKINVIIREKYTYLYTHMPNVIYFYFILMYLQSSPCPHVNV